ncbi:L-fucose isomerase-like protein [Candidatus Vecturithrix granuli]|uniref:L-fucose isomerase-like protein n=1 Tax=Vecturithrix granuli TaxID=1499967 RepID=A0A081BUT8_VECG1|nr:L-fucose isomerase-like protein [Candidatus Vecturithrix granuli]
MEPLKAGYVSFGTMYYKPEKLREISGRAEQQLTARGIELIRTDPVFGEDQEPDRAIRELKAQEWDFLIANVINWIDTRGVIRVLMEFRDKPLVLYSFGGFTEGDTLICPAAGAGSTSLRFPLEKWRFKFIYLFNPPDSPMDVDGIIKFGRAAQVMKKLRYTRVGMIGFNDMGLYSTDFNVTRLRDKIGTEVESVDLLQLQRKMDVLSAEVVKNEMQRITRTWEYPLGKPQDEVIERVIRMYLATVAICKEKKFSGFSYKCVDGIDLEMKATHAVPSALVASAGYPYVDENDIGNLIAELMLKWISGKQVMFLEHYDHHPEWILLGEDGYIPDEFIDGNPQIKNISTVLLGGIAHCSKMKTGRMTLACLSEDGDGYRMHIVSGEGKTPPQWVEMGVPLPSWPSVKFFPDASVRSILNHVQSQHFAAVYGDYVDELRYICDLMGIEPVIDSK